MKGFKERSLKKMKKSNQFVVERNDIETVWRIHIDETFVLGSKDPDGIEEIQQKLDALIDIIEKYRV